MVAAWTRKSTPARREPVAWSLTGGAACVFALAAVLKGLPWQIPFAVVAAAVAVWAWRSRIVAGAAVGAIAWMCVSGFDVHRLGDIRITGSGDVLRAAGLVLLGTLPALARALAGAAHRLGRSGRRAGCHKAGPLAGTVPERPARTPRHAA